MPARKQSDKGLQQSQPDAVVRFRRLIARTDLDCRCRENLECALDRFLALEARRVRRNALAEAQDYRTRIAALLSLLSELDEITDREQDRSAFLELIHLFEDVATTAMAGADAIRRSVSGPLS